LLKKYVSGTPSQPQAPAPIASSSEIAAHLKSIGQKYEPDKYDYRINPQTRIVEAKAKSQ